MAANLFLDQNDQLATVRPLQQYYSLAAMIHCTRKPSKDHISTVVKQESSMSENSEQDYAPKVNAAISTSTQSLVSRKDCEEMRLS